MLLKIGTGLLVLASYENVCKRVHEYHDMVKLEKMIISLAKRKY